MGVSSNSSIWIIIGALVWLLTADLFITNYLNDSNIRATRNILDDVTDENFQTNLKENLTISTNFITGSISTAVTPFQVFWKAVFFQLRGLPRNVLFFGIQLPTLILIAGIVSLIRFG